MAECGAITKSPYPLLSVEDALQTVLQHAVPLPSVSVAFQEALGATAAADVTALDPLPPYPASIKDGFAVISNDGPGEFPIVAEARAGDDAADVILQAGSVAYITTGGPLPAGADAVVQVEDTEPVTSAVTSSPSERIVRILKAAKPGQDVRPVGSDISAGTLVLSAGDRIDAAEVGLLAAVGATNVQVYRRPLVAVLSTGDELVDPSAAPAATAAAAGLDAAPAAPTAAAGPGPSSLPRGMIRDANRSMLMSAVRQQHPWSSQLDLGIAADSQSAVEEAITKALQAKADVILTSGGVSMGDRDCVKPVLERMGTVHFGRVLMKPGKPLTFASLLSPEGHQCLVFGLPGNPVSCLVCFNLFVLPALRRMSGWGEEQTGHRRVQVRLADSLPLDPQRPEFHRATLSWEAERKDGSRDTNAVAQQSGFIASSTGRQISSRLLSMRSAHALLELPRASGSIPASTLVPAILISDLSSSLVPSTTPLPSPTVIPPASSDGTSTPLSTSHTSCSHHHHHTAAPSAHLPEGQQTEATAAAGTTGTGTGSVAGDSMAVRGAGAGAGDGGAGAGIRVGVLTVSDSVASGVAEDASGPCAVSFITSVSSQLGNASVVATAVVPDDIQAIQAIVKLWTEVSSSSADSGSSSHIPPSSSSSSSSAMAVDLLITTGGTGLSPRDVTPEACRPLMDKEAPGLAHAMLDYSIKVTKFAVLSRMLAGICNSTLILNLPGNPNAVRECLEAILPVLPHAIRQMKGDKREKHHPRHTPHPPKAA